MSDKEQFIQKITESLSDTKGEFMTIADELRQEGRLQGRQEGNQEGKQELTHQIATKLLAEGADVDFASRITGMSKDALIQLQKEKSYA